MIELIDLIRCFLRYQGKINPDRWYTMPEMSHALFLFGDWTTFDVRTTVGKLIEMDEVEKSTRIRFRWKNKEASDGNKS